MRNVPSALGSRCRGSRRTPGHNRAAVALANRLARVVCGQCGITGARSTPGGCWRTSRAERKKFSSRLRRDDQRDGERGRNRTGRGGEMAWQFICRYDHLATSVRKSSWPRDVLPSARADLQPQSYPPPDPSGSPLPMREESIYSYFAAHPATSSHQATRHRMQHHMFRPAFGVACLDTSCGRLHYRRINLTQHLPEVQPFPPTVGAPRRMPGLSVRTDINGASVDN